MYLYRKKNQLLYINNPFMGFYKLSPSSFYDNSSPLFYIIVALGVTPFFRFARSILGVVDYSTVAQIQIAVLFAGLSFCICFGITRLLPLLDQKYNFTKRIFASKSFEKWICTGLAIENGLRSPKNWFFFGLFFCLYLILLFWVLFYSYSLSFKDMPFVYICRVLGYILCVNISLYIKCRSSIISHYTLRLNPKEKITRWSICRSLGYYRPIEKRPVLDSIYTPNKVYTNCTLLFEKKGMAGYIEGVYNFRTHARNFFLGFGSTLLSYCGLTAFYHSIDGYGGMRSDSLFFLRLYMKRHTEFLETKDPSSYLTTMAHSEMLEDCQSLKERMAVHKAFKDPSSRTEDMQKRVSAYIEKERLYSNKELDIYTKVEKDLSDKSFVYFLFPKNYNRLKNLYHLCSDYKQFKGVSKDVEELWKV